MGNDRCIDGARFIKSHPEFHIQPPVRARMLAGISTSGYLVLPPIFGTQCFSRCQV
jgi:hypothetical protein